MRMVSHNRLLSVLPYNQHILLRILKWSIVKSRFCAGAILSKYFQASQKDLPLASLKNAFSIMLRIYRMCFSHFSCLHTHILVLSGYPHVPESSGHPVEQLLW